VRRLWCDEGLVCKPRARKKRRTGPAPANRSGLPPNIRCAWSASTSSPAWPPAGGTSGSSPPSTNTPARPRHHSRSTFEASDVVALLEMIIAETCVAPAYLRCDNGPRLRGSRLRSIGATPPGSTPHSSTGIPWQNGFIESFNAQFRREQLPGEIMDTVVEAKYLAEEWKAIYKHERPHGSLANITMKRYCETWTEKTEVAIA
jgi:putative transposase